MDREPDDDYEVGLDQLDQDECAGCDSIASVDDVGLCSACAGKLERDLIRVRDWAYSALAFGVPPDRREQLRQLVINQHGEALELIAPTGTKRPTKNHANPAAQRQKNGQRKR